LNRDFWDESTMMRPSHRTQRVVIPALFAIVVLAGATTVGQDADFGVIIREFATGRHKLENELATELALPIPPGVHEFFGAAEAGDAQAVSNLFLKLRMPGPHGSPLPELQNELWAPVHETLGVYEVWVEWQQNSRLLKTLAESVLASMPSGSVYFGGTDSGRFVITTANAVRDPSPVFCLTQNALADNTYLSHLRQVYGKQLWIPAQADSQQAFQQFVARWQAGQAPRNAGVTIANGQVQVTSLEGVMAINGILCQMIFEHNKAAHEFFIEESYVVDWMYPYLEPHGFIMKLNKEPVRELSAEIVAKDQAFWTDTIATLRKQPGFAGNQAARNAFAKLRTGSAGIYVSRQRYDDAERAFDQALELYPGSPDANFRLAKLWEQRGRVDRAIELLQAFIARAPETAGQRATDYLKALQSKRPLTADERLTLTRIVQGLSADQASARSTAKRGITEFGVRALPLLREHADDKDPEVRMSIKELIRELSERNVTGSSD